MIIILNGPTGSGKTTAAKLIGKMFPSSFHYKLSKPLTAAVAGIYGLTGEDVKYLEENKEEYSELLYGVSYRDAQVAIFNHLAEEHNYTVLARLAIRRLKEFHTRVYKHTIIECGLTVEAEVLRKNFAEVGIIQLHHPDCTFDDYREYIDTEFWKNVEQVNNIHDIELFTAQLHRVFVKWEILEDD